MILASSPFANVFISFCPGIVPKQPTNGRDSGLHAHSCLQMHEDSLCEGTSHEAYSVHKCDSNRIRWVSMKRNPAMTVGKTNNHANVVTRCEVQLIAVCVADARDVISISLQTIKESHPSDSSTALILPVISHIKSCDVLSSIWKVRHDNLTIRHMPIVCNSCALYR